MFQTVSVVAARSLGAAAQPLAQVALVGAVIWLAFGTLSEEFGALDASSVSAAFAQVNGFVVFAALGFAAASLLCVSAYDALAWPLVDKSVPRPRAMRSGFAAVAIGQTTGFSPLVGCFVRYRLLRRSGVDAVKSAKTTALASFGFLFGLAAGLSLLFLVRPDAVASALGVSPAEAIAAAGASLVILAGAAYALTRKGALRLRDTTLPAPDCGTLTAFAVLAMADIGFAAAALWMLVPESAGLSYEMVFIAFAAAMTAGLISGAPGGVGVFEATLFLLLPVAAAPLVAAILMFRVIYFLIPFAIGVAILGVSGLDRAARRRAAAPVDRGLLAPGLAASDRAEAQLALLGDKSFLLSKDREAFVMYGVRAGSMVVMGDPVGPRRCWPELISDFLDLAEAQRRTPAFYKIGPAAAALCRSMGLRTDRFGHEAEVDPQTFDLSARSRRRLRRQVRKAEKSGMAVDVYPNGGAPLPALRAVSDAWLAAKRGPESGFSQGAFDEAYLSEAPTLVASLDGVPVAFVTLWRSGDGAEWSIDLMRSAQTAPQGATPALIVRAIDMARRENAQRFNLCIAPLSGLENADGPLERVFAHIFEKRDRYGLQGLRAFKASFDPEWRPRSIAHVGGFRTAMSLYAIRSLTRSAPPGARTAPSSGYRTAAIRRMASSMFSTELA